MDRNFLMAFNGILLGVLAVTIFSIVESDSDEKKNISDYINFSLIVLALIIDTVALSAIVFRLSSYGITPNRLAVLGVNVLIWANLIWIMFSYMRFLQNKSGPKAIKMPLRSICQYTDFGQLSLYLRFLSFLIRKDLLMRSGEG